MSAQDSNACTILGSMPDFVGLLAGVGVPVVAAILIAYVLLFPDQAKQISGMGWSLIARIWRSADKRAVKLRVEGQINAARAALFRHAPADLIEGELVVEWTNAEEAEARVRDGNVVVFMRPSQFQEDNVAHALMAYLPRALLRTARKYLSAETMRAVDLTVAKAFLTRQQAEEGALQVFLDRHLDAARAESASLRSRIEVIDSIDLHGWLTRVLLAEYRRLGFQLHPGEPPAGFEAEAEAVVDWLHRLATRAPKETTSLTFRGRYFRIGVIFVAASGRLEVEGLRPYRRRIARDFAEEHCDVVYVMARDRNIPAVRLLVEDLVAAGAEPPPIFEYRLRSDFAARLLNRDRAVCMTLRRSETEDAAPVGGDLGSQADQLPSEAYTPPILDEGSAVSAAGPSVLPAPAATSLSEPATARNAEVSTAPSAESALGSEVKTRPAVPPRMRTSASARNATTSHTVGEDLVGVVRVLPRGQNYGYLHDDCGHVWFFRRWELLQLSAWSKISIGTRLSFRVSSNQRGPLATRIRLTQ